MERECRTENHRVQILVLQGTFWRAVFIPSLCHIQVPQTERLKHQNVWIYDCEGCSLGGTIARLVPCRWQGQSFQVPLLAFYGLLVIFGVLWLVEESPVSAFISTWLPSWVYGGLLVSMPSSYVSHLHWSYFQINLQSEVQDNRTSVHEFLKSINFVWNACRN